MELHPTSFPRPLRRDVLLHELRLEGEDLLVARVHRGPDPVYVGVAEGLDAGEVQDAGLLVALLGVEGLVDAEVVAIAVDENDRPLEGDGLAPEGLLELGEARGLVRVLLEDVGLDHEHHRLAATPLRRPERALEPSEAGRVAGPPLLLVADGRGLGGGAVFVWGGHPAGGGRGAPGAPAGVLRGPLVLALERYLPAAQRVVVGVERGPEEV